MWRSRYAEAFLDSFRHRVAHVGAEDACIRDRSPGDNLAIEGMYDKARQIPRRSSR